MVRNSEHYPDPTAGAALRQMQRKENELNTGKQFEADFKKSMPPDAWCYRLRDSAATYYGGNENLAFSVDNICDFIVYRHPVLYLMELKTIDTPSIPLQKIFGKYDPDKKQYHKIKHITDMITAASTEGITAYVIINYRGKVNRTFAVQAFDILHYSITENRKSIPWQWAALHGIEIAQRQLRVHWRYDVEAFLREIEVRHA